MHCASIEMLQPKSPISASLLLEYTIPTPTLLTAGVTHSPEIHKLGQADFMRVEKLLRALPLAIFHPQKSFVFAVVFTHWTYFNMVNLFSLHCFVAVRTFFP